MSSSSVSIFQMPHGISDTIRCIHLGKQKSSLSTLPVEFAELFSSLRAGYSQFNTESNALLIIS